MEDWIYSYYFGLSSSSPNFCAMLLLVLCLVVVAKASSLNTGTGSRNVSFRGLVSRGAFVSRGSLVAIYMVLASRRETMQEIQNGSM